MRPSRSWWRWLGKLSDILVGSLEVIHVAANPMGAKALLKAIDHFKQVAQPVRDAEHKCSAAASLRAKPKRALRRMLRSRLPMLFLILIQEGPSMQSIAGARILLRLPMSKHTGGSASSMTRY